VGENGKKSRYFLVALFELRYVCLGPRSGLRRWVLFAVVGGSNWLQMYAG
jgi:hypothetical protein